MHSTTKVMPNSTNEMPDKTVLGQNKTVLGHQLNDDSSVIEKDLRDVLLGDRYILYAVNADEFRLKRIKPNEIVTSLDKVDKHIQNAIGTEREVLERIALATHKKLNQ